MNKMRSEYIPGVCNICPDEIRIRYATGWTGLVVTLVAWVILFVLLGPYSCADQKEGGPFVIGDDIYKMDMRMDEHLVYSRIVKDYFKIDVSWLEDRQEAGGRKIPAVYITDGYWRGVDHKYVHYLAFKGKIEAMYAVGIGYPQGYDYGSIRERDLTDNPDKFKQAMDEEIIPFVESRYQIDGNRRILYGASYGGYFSLYSLLSDAGPQKKFVTYIASCPVPKTGIARTDLMRQFRSVKTTGVNLYFGVGSLDNKYIVNVSEELSRILGEGTTTGLAHAYRLYENHDHYSVCRNVIVDALLFFHGKGAPPISGTRGLDGIRDLVYQNMAYNFNQSAGFYDWSVMYPIQEAGAKKIAREPGSAYGKPAGVMKVQCRFSPESPLAVIGTTFDHFEDLTGKKVEVWVRVAEQDRGAYEIALKASSTYDWAGDESQYQALTEAGWQKFVFPLNEAIVNGKIDLVRGLGFVLRPAGGKTSGDADIMLSDISWY